MVTMKVLNWRTDIENAPTDGTEVLLWDGRAAKVCHWVATSEEYNAFRRGDPEYGWAYAYDHEYSMYYTVVDPKFWCEISPPYERHTTIKHVTIGADGSLVKFEEDTATGEMKRIQ